LNNELLILEGYWKFKNVLEVQRQQTYEFETTPPAQLKIAIN